MRRWFLGACAALALGASAHAQVAISQLTPATTPLSGSEIVPIVQNGATRRSTVLQFLGSYLTTPSIWTATQYFQSPASRQDQSSYGIQIGRYSAAYLGSIINMVDTSGGSNHPTFLSMQFNGVEAWRLSSNGAIASQGSVTAAQSFFAGASSAFQFTGRTQILSPADGVLEYANAAGTDFTKVDYGGTTSAYPALKRSGAALAARLADDSGDANLAAGKLTASAGVQLPVTTVAALPACSSGNEGLEYGVSDSTTLSFHAAPAGGGSNHVKVYCSGTAGWVVGG